MSSVHRTLSVSAVSGSLVLFRSDAGDSDQLGLEVLPHPQYITDLASSD